MKTVKEMYQEAKTTNKKLLSDYPAEWWEAYITAHDYFDRAFSRLYKSFEFFDQEEDDTISEVLASFQDAVYGHLLINDKRYAEMYRIQGLADADLPMTYNYDMTEIMQKEINNEAAMISGQRTDVSNNAVGEQTAENVNKSSPMNSGDEKVVSSGITTTGSRNDVNQFTKGQQGDTSNSKENEDYTLTRKGNIGVQTGADILMSFDKAMPVFNFYSKVFGEIAATLLDCGRWC